MKILLVAIMALLVLAGCSEQTETTKTQKNTETKIEKVTKTPNLSVINSGEDLYKSCSGCHGIDSGKSALNKSKIIKGWKKEEIISALNGYKDGSYGGSMRSLMKGQVIKLSNEDIKILAEYISDLR